MLRNIIILILLLVPSVGFSWECVEDEPLVVTSPLPGAHIIDRGVVMRGFVCRPHYLVVIKNITTHGVMMVDTEKNCDTKDRCIYSFITFVDNLAIGLNELIASIPNQDPPVEVEIEVTRTALAGL